MADREFLPGDRVVRLVFGPNGATRTWRRGTVIKKLRTRYRVDWGGWSQDHPANDLHHAPAGDTQ